MDEANGQRRAPSFREQWAVMSFYERFEEIIALILSGVIALVIAMSMLQLIRVVLDFLVKGAFNPLDYSVFQTVFGMVMTLLIALEFKHSIIRVVMRKDNIIQVKTVVLIALLALARKFVVLDPETPPDRIAALSGAVLALGIVYWLMRERDQRALDAERAARSEQQAGSSDAA
jgi:uncharacterized membrane protein (DUF373 family)